MSGSRNGARNGSAGGAGTPGAAFPGGGGYRIETWGCQMNVHDSEKMAASLGSLGLAPESGEESAEESEVVVLNTCSVREKAQEKVFTRVEQLVRGRRRPTFIGVAGCVAQQEGAAIFARAPAVDFVLGTRCLPRLPEIVRRLREGEGQIVETGQDPGNLDIPPEQISRIPGVKAYITVMEGCDNFCSFCVVPFTRGRERCRPTAAIVREAESLVASGFAEVQLLGQNVNSYRDPDDGRGFADLVGEVGRVPGIRRIRFTSPHPKDFDRALMRRFAEGGPLMPSMHLPAQSGSTTVLARMRRGYSREEFLALARTAREVAPGLELSTDLIVGFCGETDAEFEETLTLLDEVRFSSVYSFRYSERPHTLAAKRLPDDVPKEVKTGRLIELQARQREIQLELHRDLVGREVEVLVEGPSRKGGQLTGRAPDNRVVNFRADDGRGPGEWVGEFARVRITGYGPNSLLGEAAPPLPAHRARPSGDFAAADRARRASGVEIPLPVIQQPVSELPGRTAAPAGVR